MSWRPPPPPRASRPVFLWRARCPDRLRLPLLRSFPRLERRRVARERVALAGRPPHGGLAGHTRPVEHALHHPPPGRERPKYDDPEKKRPAGPRPQEKGRGKNGRGAGRGRGENSVG